MNNDRLAIDLYFNHIRETNRIMLNYMNEKNVTFDGLLTSKDKQHPPIVKLFLSKKINFESVVILNDILGFAKRLNKTIGEKVLWPKIFDRMIRYKPFLKYNITKYKMTLKKKVKEI